MPNKAWFRDNSTLIVFLIAQLVAFGTAGASILAYMVKLETRVSIMETRGAEYTVARMEEMKQRITVLEQQIEKNSAQIERLVDQYLKKPL
jgi:uncharacterized coiled-coil protein SlyX